MTRSKGPYLIQDDKGIWRLARVTYKGRNVDRIADYDYEYLERLHDRVEDPEEQELISRALFS